MHLFHSVEQSIEICLRAGRLIETYSAITEQFRQYPFSDDIFLCRSLSNLRFNLFDKVLV